ncbi:NPCBM/NEW2 domain-containing protein, partial [Streptomyces sp. URMC 125]|uniref:NPCBM/NEW2 domain-containing protein n=1 Tax=Streptomyces sp. URMC 125 TaxID=3423419 RepID=UPI003F1A41CE
ERARERGEPPEAGDAQAREGTGPTEEHGPSPFPEERSPSDAELVSLARGGDTAAYAALRARHVAAVRHYVRHCCRDDAGADELTDEVFLRTLSSPDEDPGPDTAVRAHLLATVRRVAASWAGTAGWDSLTGEFAVFAVASGTRGGGETFESDAGVRAMWRAERSAAVRAFRSLPERWQAVLWHTVVEEEAPRVVAPLLGLTAEGTAELAQRAVEGLQQAYLQTHLALSRTGDGACAPYVDRLGTYARGGLRTRSARALHRHLDRCPDCRSAARGARDVRGRLRALLPVAVVGWGAGVYSAEAAQAAAGLAAGAAPGADAPAAGGATAGGAAVFEGLGATAKAGVTAGVMAAAVATALTLALVGDGQRSRGPVPDSAPGSGARPSAASVSGEAGPEARGAGGVSEPRAVEPGGPADAAGGEASGPRGRPPVPPHGPDAGPSPSPGAGSPRVPAPAGPHGPAGAAGADRDAGPGTGPTPTGSAPADGRTDGPAGGGDPGQGRTPPPAATVHRLDRLPRGGPADDGPAVRGGSSWLWQRPQVSIGGRERGHGVTVSARSSVTVDLGRPCTSFDALAGVDDLTALRGAVRFSVYADGARLWRSGVVRRGDEPVPVHVPLSGRRALRLVVEPYSALDVAVLADWAGARIGCG